MSLRLAGFVLALSVLSGALPLAAQAGTRGADILAQSEEEGRLLREAAALEWRGRHDEAEELLMGLLEDQPTSSGGLYALTRILRARSRVDRALPWVDRYLDRSPDAAGVHYLKLQLLIEVDSLSALEPAAEAWFVAEPDSPDPWREVARLWARAFGDEAALEILERGRRELGDGVAAGDAFAMELGDVRLRLGDAAGAIEAWSRAVRVPDAELALVLRRVDRIMEREDGAIVLEPLLEALTREPASFAMQAAAVRVALGAGLEERARTITAEALPSLAPGDRPELLSEVAQLADETGAPDLRLWALVEQRARMRDEDTRGLDVRIASAALAAGDTAAALDAQVRVARALPPGSMERRRVIADLIRVEVADGAPATLRQRLEGFAREFPEATELDELTAAVAAAVAARGSVTEALTLLDPPRGPRSSLERAWLLFGEGDLEAGRNALERALPALPPSQATGAIQLLALLDRTGPQAGEALMRAGALAHRGDPAEAARLLAEVADSVAAEDRPPLLAQAARWGEAGGIRDAPALWLATIVTQHPESPEHAEAILDLARLRIAEPEGRGLAEARALLQQLILDRPNSPVVPAARRELQRIGRGP